MQLIDWFLIDYTITHGGTCAGCHEGSCLPDSGYHCPCEGCECTDSRT